jgi:TonB family protein
MKNRHAFRGRLLICSICAVVSATSVSTAAVQEQSGTGSAAPETVAQAAPKLSKPHTDPAHPLTFHGGVYPAEAIKHGEEGVCWVRIMVDADGSIRASQLLRSTGYGILDGACLLAFPGQRMLPALQNGSPVIAWTNIPNVWKLSTVKHRDFDRRPPIPDAAPRIKDDYQLQVGPAFHPVSLGAVGKHGNCVVSMNVSDMGAVTEPQVIESANSAALDRACVDAAANAQFNPGLEGGHPIKSSTYLAMYW